MILNLFSLLFTPSFCLFAVSNSVISCIINRTKRSVPLCVSSSNAEFKVFKSVRNWTKSNSCEWLDLYLYPLAYQNEWIESAAYWWIELFVCRLRLQKKPFGLVGADAKISSSIMSDAGSRTSDDPAPEDPHYLAALAALDGRRVNVAELQCHCCCCCELLMFECCCWLWVELLCAWLSGCDVISG